MPDWLVALLGGAALVAVLLKAFCRPPKRDPLKPETTGLPPGVV